jgi:hypothetical protein
VQAYCTLRPVALCSPAHLNSGTFDLLDELAEQCSCISQCLRIYQHRMDLQPSSCTTSFDQGLLCLHSSPPLTAYPSSSASASSTSWPSTHDTSSPAVRSRSQHQQLETQSEPSPSTLPASRDTHHHLYIRCRKYQTHPDPSHLASVEWVRSSSFRHR